MPSEFRGQKTLHQWIELDYHERPRKLRRWRTACIWGVFLISVAGVVAAVLTPQASKLYQAGNLTQSHAMFNHDCKICHLEAFATAKKLVNWSSDLKAVPDQACISCHAGPPQQSCDKTAV